MRFIDWFLNWFRKPVDPTKPPADVDMLALHNAQRAKLGVAPLRVDPLLEGMAVRHAQYMAAQRSISHDYFHDRAQQSGYPFADIRENAAIGFNPVQVVDMWLGSPGHASNILHHRMRDCGFGSARGGDGQTYWCAVYAVRR